MKLLKNTQVFKKIYDNLLNEIAKKYELTTNELKILLFLQESQENDIARDIVNTLMLSKSHVSMSVDFLEKKKYLERLQDEKDKKKYHLKITNKANVIIEDVNKKQEELKEILYKGISQEEIKTMNSIIEKMRNNINDCSINKM